MAPAAALLVRDNFEISTGRLEAIAPYTAISAIIAAVLFPSAGINRIIWRYTSLSDALRIAGAVALSIGLALCAAFALNRLEGVARSLPVIQWFLLVSAMTGMRVAMRLPRPSQTPAADGSSRGGCFYSGVEHVLVVGLNPVTECYLRSIGEFAPRRVLVAGILAEQLELRGLSVHAHRVLGSPAELPQLLAQLEVHGVTIDRIVITEPFEQLSARGREALLVVERSRGVKLDFFMEPLGLMPLPRFRESRWGDRKELEATREHASLATAAATDCGEFRHYGQVKRIVDVCGASILFVALTPIITLVGLLVALDVGFPLLFWQQRPGRYGRPFKLYKFRTMSPAYDAEGNRLPDEERSTTIGRCLRRLRLDELPQLYNILIGEMSFVGPRPLLPVDQSGTAHARLLARPGLTGWAQVNGGREISVEDKTALDIWYLRNASFWLDVRILLQTVILVATGERRNDGAIRLALDELGIARAAAAETDVALRPTAPVLLTISGEKTA
jgi:lipopolysaccharide/colanic/teichoic acid biosynthesis glycosyltransferase